MLRDRKCQTRNNTTMSVEAIGDRFVPIHELSVELGSRDFLCAAEYQAVSKKQKHAEAVR